MNQIDKRNFKELVVKDVEDKTGRIADYRKYQDCCKDLNELGRYHVDEAIKKHGYARVLQAFAANIIRQQYRYDSDVIYLALQIPMPVVREIGVFTNLHPAIIQGEFKKLIRYHLAV